jgi:Glucodextranase, domain B
MRVRASTAALVAGLLGVLACAPRASAAMTSSSLQVVSPPGTYLVFDEVAGAETITVSGTTNATPGEKLDINCYAAKKRYLLAAEVQAGAGGSFSFTGLFGTIAGRTCVLRAVPHNDTTDYAPGSPSAFQGPTLGLGRRGALTVASGPNNGALLWYYLYASQLAGGFDYRSLGDCSILDSYVYDPVTFAPSRLDDCDATLWWQNGASGFPGVAVPTRSEIQVDGANAYLPANAGELFAGSENDPGFPVLKYRYEVEPASGNLVLEETDQVVRCAPGASTYPPTAVSCSSFVPTGVEAYMAITQADNGRVAAVTQWFYSTDGAPHTVDLLEQNQFEHVNEDGELDFPWLGEGFQKYGTAGQQLAAPVASVPGSLLIKGSASVPDGSEESPEGALTFSNPPEGETVVGSTLNPESWLDLHYHRAIPAGGSFALGFTYSDGFLLSEVQQLAASAQASYLPHLAISAPAEGSVTSAPHVTVSGTAEDQTGISSLVVAGRSVPVAANGSWSATVPLSPGANTITATATNVFGYTALAHTTITYVPTVLTLKGRPEASGKRGARGVRFTLSCQGAPGTSCEGVATLTSTEHKRGKRLVALSARRRARTRKRPIRLIRVSVSKPTSFSIPAGQTRALFVALNATGRRLLSLAHKLPVTLSVTLTNGPNGSTLVARVGVLVTRGGKPKARHRGHRTTDRRRRRRR